MFKNILKDRVILVDILSVLFGISSWVAVNGVWTQTPLLVERLPEQWNLTSYVVMIVQLANIGPIVYSILKFKFSLKAIEKPCIHVTLGIGAVACLLLSIFWDKITVINGTKHSVAFLILTALLAVVDCTTSVLYLPFMAHFKSKYLVSYLTGQALSGLIPSFIALAQGASDNPECVNSTTTHEVYPKYPEPRFSVSVFYVCLLVLVLFSWTAFVLLNRMGRCRKELVLYSKKSSGFKAGLGRTTSTGSDVSSDSSIGSKTESFDNHSESNAKPNNESNEQNISRKTFITLLLTQAYICSLTNGLLPSIQSYSCMPYGNTAYFLAVNISSIVNPIACLIAFYVKPKWIIHTLPGVISLGTACAIYAMVTAVLSPTPPLQNTGAGNALIVLTWIGIAGLFAYSRACIASILRNNTGAGHNSLFFCGVFTQIGSTCGAVIMFCIINFTSSFVSTSACG
ncbi:unnamed protein product [Oppiella nova]|uniref:Riboflavin transporter n=1 Tax=Oppiella nova TaxID=334625 RepID=A0A7R9M737_9ACAR|nr:unnamed protein product [Oppiella nova]CAG2171881.1 unnamed protein product [Oppiella nova]